MKRCKWDRNSKKNLFQPTSENRSRTPVRAGNRGYFGKALAEIVDPGASWRKYFCASSTIKALIVIFSLVASLGGSWLSTPGFICSPGNLVKV
jgi:hypothetical protein